MAAVAVLIAGCAGAAPRHDRGDELAEIAWLAGDWVGQGPDGSPAEERWSTPEHGAMVGRALGETLRIEARGGAIVYVAHPAGAEAPTVFTAVELGEGRATFENAAHDFPQRIRYELQPDRTLTATISGLSGEGALVWRFQREEVGLSRDPGLP